MQTDASAGNRTRINCLEGSYADHYTTDAIRSPLRVFYHMDILKRISEVRIDTPTRLSRCLAVFLAISTIIKRSQSTSASIAQWQSVGLVNQRS